MNWDTVFQRISNLSQLGLLLLALFGYIYTVRPVYTKSVLEEEIAKKQLEIKEKDKYISGFNGEIQAKKQELAALQKESAYIKARLTETQKNYLGTRSELASTISKLGITKQESSLTLKELNKTKELSNVYYNELRSKVMAVVNGSLLFSCSGVTRLSFDDKREYKNLGNCFDETAKSKGFIEVYSLLQPDDKNKLVHLFDQVDAKTIDNVKKIRAEYEELYANYKNSTAELDKRSAMLQKDMPNDPNSEAGINFRIQNLDKQRKLISERSNISTKYIEETGAVSDQYHKLIENTLNWVSSEFGVK